MGAGNFIRETIRDFVMPRPDIWMPLYIGDYLSDTQLLTTEQHGAYLLLIMAYWKNGGPLPDDDALLSKVCGLSLRRFKSQKKTLSSFFLIEENKWKKTRIDEEILRAEKHQKAAKSRGKAGAAARWSNASSNAQSIDGAMLKQCKSPSPSPNITLPREELLDTTTGEIIEIGGSDERA